MITENMKIFNTVFKNPQILMVIERFDVPMGFGEKTFKEMCSEQNIDEYLFLTIANLYCCKKDVSISPSDIEKINADQVLQFLKNSHTYFLDEKIPRLKALIDEKTEKSPNDKYSLIINKFINDYATEVYEHMHYEDAIVFPYVESLLHPKSQTLQKYNIEKFKKHHSNIEDKLTDLKNLLIKHIPTDYDSVVRRQMLFELHDLEHDISIHDFVENNLLIPFVERLEMESNEE